MRVAIIGAGGLLGRTLVRRWSDLQPIALSSSEIDITSASDTDVVISEAAPEVVVLTAAYTAVDACESSQDHAYAVNERGTANVARACERHGARLIALSTDYVFPGDADRPYHEWDPVGPKTVYGSSKLAGEESVRRYCGHHTIARTAWLYGPGGPSFVHTMLKLGAEAGAPLKVVDDQVGNPTSTDALADGLRGLLERPIDGTVHLSCEGETSWYGFAKAIFEARGLPRDLQPCATSEFPRPAPRPANSRLEKRALRLRGRSPMADWRESLERFFREHPQG